MFDRESGSAVKRMPSMCKVLVFNLQHKISNIQEPNLVSSLLPTHREAAISWGHQLLVYLVYITKRLVGVEEIVQWVGF